MVTKPIPDLNEAQRFLDFLERGGKFWFQLAEEPKPKEGKALARVLHGTLAELGDQLVKLNLSGYAVWVQINAGTGRTNADVDRIRGYFVDQDHGHTELLLESAVPADAIVESSPGKFHGYWLTKNAPLDQFSGRMRALAEKFQGDFAICHLARVMRLPGFLHLKAEPFMSRIVTIREGL